MNEFKKKNQYYKFLGASNNKMLINQKNIYNNIKKEKRKLTIFLNLQLTKEKISTNMKCL